MKKKVIAGMLALTMVVSGILFGPTGISEVHAVDTGISIESPVIAFKDLSLADSDGWEDISVGEEFGAWTKAVDADGNILECVTDWLFIDDAALVSNTLESEGLDLQFYSKYGDVKQALTSGNYTPFDGNVPEEAFGKYIYKWTGIIRVTDEGPVIENGVAIKLVRSEYPVTDRGGTEYQSFSLNNDNKSVSVFAIYNHAESYKATFPRKIKVAGKEYKVTAIDENAFMNDDNAGTLTGVTLHSGITKIGKSAFEGAKNLKTISIQGNIVSVGKNAFKGINKKAVFKIKASKKNYTKIVNLIKKSGVAKTVKFVRVK